MIFPLFVSTFTLWGFHSLVTTKSSPSLVISRTSSIRIPIKNILLFRYYFKHNFSYRHLYLHEKTSQNQSNFQPLPLSYQSALFLLDPDLKSNMNKRWPSLELIIYKGTCIYSVRGLQEDNYFGKIFNQC